MKYHFIGIAGSSMSGLALVMRKMGHKITGCDLNLKKHSTVHITKDLDAIVITSAITPGTAAWEEVEKAKEYHIPVIKRSKIIGRLMQEKKGIAIAGTHGKTTTSAMIVKILQKAKKDPTFFLGGEIPRYGNAGLGKGEYLVAEACEYERQFLDFRPKIAVITNIEVEHPDTYPGGIKEIKVAFKKFVKLLPKNGILVLNQDDKLSSYLKKVAKCKVKSFSFQKSWPGLHLKIPGKHNVANATAAARVCHEIGVPSKTIKEVLNNFTGAKRRFEIKGEKKGVLIVDDYAHHPTEIKATLKGAREFYPKRRIICVFQPHQYLRTEAFFDEFAQAFGDCDKLILTEIYSVAGREPKQKKFNSQDLAEEIAKKSQSNVVFIKDYNQIVDLLCKNVRQNDLIITMGATKIYEVGEKLLSCLSN